MSDIAKPVIYWFRQDLRLSDLPGLAVWTGMALIIAAGLFVFLREQQLARGIARDAAGRGLSADGIQMEEIQSVLGEVMMQVRHLLEQLVTQDSPGCSV